MKIKTLWVLGKGWDGPGLVVAADEASMEENSDLWDDLVKDYFEVEDPKERPDWVKRERVIILEVSTKALLAAFEPTDPVIPATAKPESD